jgi:hypothetical protein
MGAKRQEDKRAIWLEELLVRLLVTLGRNDALSGGRRERNLEVGTEVVLSKAAQPRHINQRRFELLCILGDCDSSTPR